MTHSTNIIKYLKTATSICSRCGFCTALCPYGALKIVFDNEELYKIDYDSNKCQACDLCRKVCPILSVIYKPLSSDLLGTYIGAYVAVAKDPVIQKTSAAGGAVVALLNTALKHGVVDYIVAVKLRSLKPEIVITDEPSDVISCAGSIYLPVPLGTAIKDPRLQKGRFALVGLPCHIHAVKRLLIQNSSLRKNLVFSIGLFCGGVPLFSGTTYLLKKMGISLENVLNIRYRWKGALGYPGGLYIELRDGSSRFLPYQNYVHILISSRVFHPLGCFLCNDKTSKLADIAVGDAWFLAGKTDLGVSVLLIRTKIGLEMLKLAVNDGVLYVKPITPALIIHSQKGLYSHLMAFKERLLATFTFMPSLKKFIPYVVKEYERMSMKRFLGYLLVLLINSALNRWKILSSTSIPLSLMKIIAYISHQLIYE